MDKARRAELKAEYKEKVPRAGIIQVTNTVTGKRLIVSNDDVDARLNRFTAELNFDTCWYRELLADWREYGAGSFVFEVIDLVEHPEKMSRNELTRELEALEALWCEKLQPYGEGGYNRPPSTM